MPKPTCIYCAAAMSLMARLGPNKVRVLRSQSDPGSSSPTTAHDLFRHLHWWAAGRPTKGFRTRVAPADRDSGERTGKSAFLPN